jgi:hypothetical protein
VVAPRPFLFGTVSHPVVWSHFVAWSRRKRAPAHGRRARLCGRATALSIPLQMAGASDCTNVQAMACTFVQEKTGRMPGVKGRRLWYNPCQGKFWGEPLVRVPMWTYLEGSSGSWCAAFAPSPKQAGPGG